jgi:hypothetical protein
MRSDGKKRQRPTPTNTHATFSSKPTQPNQKHPSIRSGKPETQNKFPNPIPEIPSNLFNFVFPFRPSSNEEAAAAAEKTKSAKRTTTHQQQHHHRRSKIRCEPASTEKSIHPSPKEKSPKPPLRARPRERKKIPTSRQNPIFDGRVPLSPTVLQFVCGSAIIIGAPVGG